MDGNAVSSTDRLNLQLQEVNTTIVKGTSKTTIAGETVTSTEHSYRTISANSVNWNDKRGWYMNLPETGERISFNPQAETDPTYRRFIVSPPPSAVVVKVGWEDNPHLPATLEAERRYMLEVDPEACEHVWGGHCRTVSDAVIFRNRFDIGDFD